MQTGIITAKIKITSPNTKLHYLATNAFTVPDNIIIIIMAEFSPSHQDKKLYKAFFRLMKYTPIPYSLFPVPCSLKLKKFVPHEHGKCYISE